MICYRNEKYVTIVALFIYYVLYMNKLYVYNERRIYPNNSLCGGFLGDTLYDKDREVCNLPCNINNTYRFIKKQSRTSCQSNSNYITINTFNITAIYPITIKQHKVYKDKYFIFIKKLRVIIHYKSNTYIQSNESATLLSEIIEVQHQNSQNGTNKTQWYLYFIPHKIKTQSYDEKLSVHFIMFDGGSRYVMKHQLYYTVKYLKQIRNKYSMYDMLKYHSIDYNSQSHFSALFYGFRFNSANNNRTYHKIIFEDFKNENYITINAHLVCDVKERFYVNNNYTGSDHNLNPPSCDESYIKNMYLSNPRCLGVKQIHQHYFNYLKDSLNYYHNKKQPVFFKLVLMDSHDGEIKSLPRIDYDFYKYLKYINDNGIMNKSVIIIAGDHGIHYGEYYNTKFGKIDHNLPLLFIV